MIKHGRKMIDCSRCGKHKLHYGLGMCSACLRRTKRETKPSFYLGTCYSEITRRTSIGDPRRPNYRGLERCSKQEFVARFIKDDKFLIQYKLWQDSGFKRGCAPSIDRIDNSRGYTLDNIQILSNIENAIKESQKSVSIRNGDIELSFVSCTEAAKYIRTTTGKLAAARIGNKKIKGWEVYES